LLNNGRTFPPQGAAPYSNPALFGIYARPVGIDLGRAGLLRRFGSRNDNIQNI